MKPFRFKLQAVQTLRERAGNEAMDRYASALRAQHEATERVRHARQCLFSVQMERNDRVQLGCAIQDLAQYHGFVTVLRERLQESEAVIDRENSRVAEAFKAMMVADQQLKVVEKFHERERAKYGLGLRQSEQKLMDEFTLQNSSKLKLEV